MLVIHQKQENEGSYAGNMTNPLNQSDLKEKSLYTNTNINNNTAEIRTGFQQDPNSTYDNNNQNILNIQQQSNLTNIMNHQNLYNDNMGMNLQNKNMPINNFNNNMNKGNHMLHLMNSPNLGNPTNLNVNNFGNRTGKLKS